MNKKEQRAELRRLVWAASFGQSFKTPAKAVEWFDTFDDKALPLVDDEESKKPDDI